MASGSQWIYIWDAQGGELIDSSFFDVGPITSISWSPDSSHIACAGGNNKIVVLDTMNFQYMATGTGTSLAAYNLSWSPDDVHMAAWYWDLPYIYIFDTESESIVNQIHHGMESVDSAIYNADGSKLATVHNGNLLYVWDIEKNEPLLLYEANQGRLGLVTWSSDNSRIAVEYNSYGNSEILILDAINGELLTRLDGHERGILQMVWDNTSTRIASGGKDYRLKIWDAITDELVWEQAEENFVTDLLWMPDGKLVAAFDDGESGVYVVDAEASDTPIRLNSTRVRLSLSPSGVYMACWGGNGNAIELWDMRTTELAYTFFKPDSCSWSGVAWLPGDLRVFLTDLDDSLCIWDVMLDDYLVLQRHSRAIESVAWNESGTHIATGSSDGTIQFWETPSVTSNCMIQLVESADVISWSPDGKYLALGRDSLVSLMESPSGLILRTFEDSLDNVICLSWSPDGTHLAAGGRDGVVLVWDLSAQEPVIALHSPDSSVTSIAWSNQDLIVAAGYEDGSIIIWDASSGQKLYELYEYDVSQSTHPSNSVTLAWQPNGNILASTSAHDGTIDYWDTLSWEKIESTERNIDGFSTCLDWSPTGRYLAHGSSLGYLAIIEFNEKPIVLNISRISDGHQVHYIQSVDWSHDEGFVATSGSYCNQAFIHLLDPRTGVYLGPVRGFHSFIDSVAWSPVEPRLASANDGEVRIWDIPRQDHDRFHSDLLEFIEFKDLNVNFVLPQGAVGRSVSVRRVD